MILGNMRELGVHGLVASCLNDACRHVALIDVSSYLMILYVPASPTNILTLPEVTEIFDQSVVAHLTALAGQALARWLLFPVRTHVDIPTAAFGAPHSIRVSSFIQTQERYRLKITNAGHLPQPPRAPRWPVSTKAPAVTP
jgi:hypothetical protein